MGEAPFSIRQGLSATPAIQYQDDLPTQLREPIFAILRDYVSISFLWERIQALFNPYGIDEIPRSKQTLFIKAGENKDEIMAKEAMLHCEWFRVYDVVEDTYRQLVYFEQEHADPAVDEPRARPFRTAMNAYFKHAGIGWQLLNGQVVMRGDDGFENIVQTAVHRLAESGRQTAASHLQEAVRALSVRPEPNYPGAMYHAMGSLECLARDLTGMQKNTLGQILKRRPDLLPSPLDEALSQIWGYASNEARHVVEGRNPERAEATLIVGLVSAITSYLSAKVERA